MLSEFQAAKLARRFELLDADEDGFITAADYDLAAARVCDAFDFAADSAQYEKVHVIYLRLWVALSRRLDPRAGGRISRDQFVAASTQVVVEAEEGYDRFIGPIAQTIFDLIDADDSGTLEVDELTRWFNAYGVCADDAERAFKAVDRNGDGVLSVDEVHRAIREFYLSDDPRAPGNLIFGPLPMKKAIEARIDGKPGHAGKARKAGAVAAKAVAGAVKK